MDSEQAKVLKVESKGAFTNRNQVIEDSKGTMSGACCVQSAADSTCLCWWLILAPRSQQRAARTPQQQELGDVLLLAPLHV